MTDSTLHRIALTMVPGIGPRRARHLLAAFGSAEAVFQARRADLLRVPEVGPQVASAIADQQVLRLAEGELAFLMRNELHAIFYTDPEYPERLRSCDDAPVLLFTRGRVSLNQPRIVSIVGTRKATAYGKQFCEALIQALVPHQALIVSGLAYGIDICAHRCAIASGLPTVACLAHGLDKIYPPLHAPVAREMLTNGGLITEFCSGTRPDAQLFPMRNRIIAGLSDCTVVVETDEKGGSMITAYIAHSYSREVFAVPGRYGDLHSTGCNLLIRRNVAGILTSPSDLIDYMNWDKPVRPAAIQKELFVDCSDDERALLEAIRSAGRIALDDLADLTCKTVSTVSGQLLDLEFRGFVNSLPGKVYVLA